MSEVAAREALAEPATALRHLPARMQFYSPITQERVLKMLRSALGPPLLAALEDPAVTELSLNSDGSAWLERVGEGRVYAGEGPGAASVLRILALIADAKGIEIGEENPSFDALLPGHGYRVIGTLPPLTVAPALTLRKKPARVITLTEYEQAGILTPSQHQVLREAAAGRLNVLIAGGSGSGKTTLANALLAQMSQTGHRIVVIEDTPELQCAARDQESLLAIPFVRSMQECLRAALRLHPDRLIFGEVRGSEVRDLLMAWNTGHRGGLCTLHADSPLDTLYRIEEMLETIPHYQPRPRQIARAIDLIVFIAVSPDRASHPAGRFVQDIVRVEGWDEQRGYQLVEALPTAVSSLTHP